MSILKSDFFTFVKTNKISIILVVVLLSVLTFKFSEDSSLKIDKTDEVLVSNKKDDVVNFNFLLQESLDIIKGLETQPDTQQILTQEVVKEFIIPQTHDWQENESVVAYLNRNGNAIKVLLKSIKETGDVSKNEVLLKTRLQINQELNKNIKKLYYTIVNFTSSLVSLNKQLLKFDIEFKENISIWVYISKKNHQEDEYEDIINSLIKKETSVENKLRFLLGGWIDQNTYEKLKIYDSVFADYKKLEEGFQTYLLKIKSNNLSDYQYGMDFIQNKKADKN